MASPEHNMAIGVLWCVGGIIVIAVVYTLAPSSAGIGGCFVGWAAIALGGIRFAWGLFASVQATERLLSGIRRRSAPPPGPGAARP